MTFFRKATLRICSGLDLGSAAGSCLEYVREHVPVDHLLITYDHQEEGVERALVWASARGVELLDLALPRSEEVTALRWGEVLGWGGDVSSVSVSLVESGWRLGAVHFVAAGLERLGALQTQLLEPLGGAFTIALSNYMRHMDTLAQQQQLAEENRRLRATLKEGPSDGAGQAEALRALEQTLTRALSLCRVGGPGAGSEAPQDDEAAGARPAEAAAGELRLAEVMTRHIRRVLKQTGGRVEGAGGAAELLGLNPSTLRKRMRKHGVPFGRSTRAS